MAYFMQPINHTTATLTLNADSHAGNVVTLNKADGVTVTLPASSGKGDVYTVFVGTTLTSNGVIQVANSTDIIQGGVSISTDAAGVTHLTAATTDTITMNGSTTGGLKGSYVRVTDVSSGIWMLEGFLVSTGAEASPFSAAV